MLQRGDAVDRGYGMPLDYPYSVLWTSSLLQIARLGRKSGLMPDLTMIGGHGNFEAGDASSGEHWWT